MDTEFDTRFFQDILSFISVSISFWSSGEVSSSSTVVYDFVGLSTFVFLSCGVQNSSLLTGCWVTLAQLPKKLSLLSLIFCESLGSSRYTCVFVGWSCHLTLMAFLRSLVQQPSILSVSLTVSVHVSEQKQYAFNAGQKEVYLNFSWYLTFPHLIELVHG